ncbi:MAG: nucleotidyltransferase substrate binding protein [Aquificaceae bacterium]|jgi:nucleotidyltransferase substrate binding protein (TIGR01987 family)|uniref:nucleotidyltransferase substrate binding protein n=1 Tax=Hydrogenobacter sp. Uz 6-8 TaxID=3384828 RepID=UPI0030A49545
MQNIKTAFRAGFLEDDELFLDMLEDRNLASRIYSEAESREVFERIKGRYMDKLERFLEGITEVF